MKNLSLSITIWLMALVVLAALPCRAENYLLNGGQESEIQFRLVQEVTPKKDTRKVVLSFVVPQSFKSPTTIQKISGADIRFRPHPSSETKTTDNRGNTVVEAVFDAPQSPIRTQISLKAKNQVQLNSLQSRAPFPVAEVSAEAQDYLEPTAQVASSDPAIRKKSAELVAGAKNQFDAVQKILTWLVDHMRYVLEPKSYDAAYSFRSGLGNCQNYSHLSAALMRAAGIPVRVVNGVTLNQPYDIGLGDAVLTMKMAQGRHSWIEVWFPDLGWVPFDPQNSQMFVSNRFIRMEVGADNNETSQDGLVRWTQAKGADGRPEFQETVEAGFVKDQVKLSGQKTQYGPRSLLLGPAVEASFEKPPPPPLPAPPRTYTTEDLENLDFTRPLVFGNLEFPQKVNFMETRGPTRAGEDGTLEMRRNFLVETAEYVSTRGRQYAQAFELKEPMQLREVSLALHKFGGRGQLWLELFSDKNGAPGPQVAASGVKDLEEISGGVGYDWVGFDFNPGDPALLPGVYWVALGFSGSPIINWFFKYGKPAGPEGGTRYKTIFDPAWSRSMAYEFNYRVSGMAPR